MVVDRYIIREILATLAGVMGVLLVIFLSNRFIRYMAELSEGGIEFRALAAFVGLKTLGAMIIILPLALFIAILLAFSRLYKDGEMTALGASGVSLLRVQRPVLALAGLVALVVGVIAFRLAPWAEERGYQLRDAQQARGEITGAAPGRFLSFDGEQGVFYFRGLSRDDGVMHDVFVKLRQDDGSDLILAAAHARAARDAGGEQIMIFEQGHRYEGRPGSASLRTVVFQEHRVRMDRPEVHPSLRKQKARPTGELVLSDPADLAEFQWRLSMPISVLVLALLAVPLSRTDPRRGRYAKLFVAILTYLVYNNLLGVANRCVAAGSIPGLFGMGWVHAVMLVAVWLLFIQQYGLRWVGWRLQRQVVRETP